MTIPVNEGVAMMVVYQVDVAVAYRQSIIHVRRASRGVIARSQAHTHPASEPTVY
jgi:predicted glutamine amidotransferase